MTNCNKSLCDSLCPSTCKLDRFKYDSESKCYPDIYYRTEKNTLVTLPASRNVGLTRQDLFLLCNYGLAVVGERLRCGDEFLVVDDYEIFEGGVSELIANLAEHYEQGRTHYIFTDTFAAYMHERTELLGIKSVCPVTAYQHYRLLESGDITSEGRWLVGDADWGQLDNILADISGEPEDDDVDLATFIARTAVDHPKSGKDRTVALLAILAERLREQVIKKWLNIYIVSMTDRKGVLHVQVSHDCPQSVKETIEQIWEEVFYEPTCAFGTVDTWS